MNEAELGFELKNALARIEALETALRKIVGLIDSEADARSFYSWRHSHAVRAALAQEKNQ